MVKVRLMMRVVYMAAGAVVALIALIMIVPGVAPVNKFLLSAAGKEASRQLSCAVSIGGISIVFPDGLLVRNVCFSDPDSIRTPVTAREVKVGIRLRSLLTAHFEIRSIHVSGIHGDLLNLRQGLFVGPVDISRLTKRAPVARRFSRPLIRNITMEQCTVSYTDTAIHINTREIIPAARLDFVYADSMSFSVQGGAGQFTSPVWCGSVHTNDVRGAIGPTSIQFGKSELRGDSVLLRLSGIIPFVMNKPWDLSVYTEVYAAGFPKMRDSAPYMKSVGRIASTGRMSGTIAQPVLDVAFTAYTLKAGTLTADSLRAEMHYADGHLHGTTRLWSVSGAAKASVYADIPHLMTSPIVGRYAVRGSASKIDAGLFVPGYAGKSRRPRFIADGEMHAAGTGVTRLPKTVSAVIRMVSDTPVKDTADVRVRVAGNTWDIAAALGRNIAVNGKGTFSDSGAISGSLHAHADSIAPVALFFTTDSVSGTLTADALINGTIGSPVVLADIRAERFLFRGFHADVASAHARYGGDTLRWESLVVSYGASALQSDGVVRWAKHAVSADAGIAMTIQNKTAGTAVVKARLSGDSLEAAVTVAGFNPAAVSPWLPAAQHLPGSLDGHGAISGTVKNPDAQLAFTFGHTVSSGSPITTTGDLTLRDGIAKAAVKVVHDGGGADLSATLPVSIKTGLIFGGNSRITATFNQMPLGIIQPVLPEQVMINKGMISGRIEVEGTDRGIPRASGSLSLQDGGGDLLDCDMPLGPVSALIDFKNDSIVIRQLQVLWGGGQITGNGWALVTAQGISTARGDITISKVRLGGCYENLDLGIQTANLHFTKDSRITFTANAVLSDTRLTQDFSLIDLGKQLKSKALLPQRPLNPLFDNVTMHIAVNLNNNLSFNSNLGSMMVDGTVTISGRPDKPSVAGQFQIVNGFVYYLDRKFTVSQGTVRQHDPQRINPSFDLTATSNVSWTPPQGHEENYEITLSAKGDLSDPSITLSSMPTLAPPQIVSLLTLGTIQMGGVGSDIGSRTGVVVSGQLAGFGTRKLARFLHVESVDIYGNVFDPTSPGTQVAITKQVLPRVSVTYTKGLSKLSQQMILVSYRILPFMYIEAQSDQQAQGGVDLKFRYSH